MRRRLRRSSATKPLRGCEVATLAFLGDEATACEAIGRIKRVERDLAFMGCHKLNLQVRGSNLEAVEFYKSLGYSTEDRVSMGKRLEEDLG